METKPDFPKGFLERIEEFAEEYIQKYPVYKIREGGKVIHDSLWGTSHLSSFEIAILDLPLIQRLRQIRQTGLSYLIFPSTTHTRFEHTLGVMFQCRKLLDSLGKIQEFEDLLNKDIQLKVRTAALLHDCGHGPFSHSSEEIYEYFDDMQEVIGPGGILEGMHPHEVLAFCIVRTSAIKTRLEEFVTAYKQPPIDLGEVADMIIGRANITNKYIVDMINGPFDADKLDYIFRDGHFSGLPLNIDLDRLWYSTQILSITEKKIGEIRY